jgi:hypothetical protein
MMLFRPSYNFHENIFVCSSLASCLVWVARRAAGERVERIGRQPEGHHKIRGPVLWPVARDDATAAVNESQPRLIMAYTDPKRWWLLGDVGVWIRGGTSFLDTSREFGINLGIRQIF